MAKKAKKKLAKKAVKKVDVIEDDRVESLKNFAVVLECKILDDMALKFGPQLGKVAKSIRKIAESMQKAINVAASKELKKEATAKKLAEQMAKLQAKIESL